MQRQPKAWMVTSLLAILCFSELAFSQQQRDTPSHRFIPVGEAPKRDAFKSPDYLKAFEEYRKLRRTEISSRRNAGATPTLPQFDLSMMEDLPPETKELIRSWSQESMGEIANEIGTEISSFNERLRAITGQSAAEGSQEPMPFNFEEDVLKRFNNVKTTFREQDRSMRAQLKKAVQEYKDKWPMEKIPPEQWLDKVQPFINSEVLDQLKNARALRDGKISELPKLKQPTVKSSQGLSARLIDSFVKTLDSKGTEYIKSAQRSNKSKKKSSWWKQFKSSANAQVKSINKSITDRTEQYASASSSSSSGAVRSPSKSSKSQPTPDRQLAGSVVAALLLIVFGLFLFLRRRAQQSAYDDEFAGLTNDPSMIRDRDSLLRAIHSAAAKLFGRGSRYWHHRELFEQFRSLSIDDADVAKLYEHTRYAANGDRLTGDDLDIARRWYKTVQNTKVNQP